MTSYFQILSVVGTELAIFQFGLVYELGTAKLKFQGLDTEPHSVDFENRFGRLEVIFSLNRSC
jgi:hypothetical protein